MIVTLGIFIYAQLSFQEKNNIKFVHSLNAENVAIEPVNTSAISFGDTNVETVIKKNRYPAGKYNTYSVSSRFYSNKI